MKGSNTCGNCSSDCKGALRVKVRALRVVASAPRVIVRALTLKGVKERDPTLMERDMTLLKMLLWLVKIKFFTF